MEIQYKSYIGREEAFEIALERNIDKLPRKGIEILTVPAIATGKPVKVLGHDEQGYYLAEIHQ